MAFTLSQIISFQISKPSNAKIILTGKNLEKYFPLTLCWYWKVRQKKVNVSLYQPLTEVWG